MLPEGDLSSGATRREEAQGVSDAKVKRISKVSPLVGVCMGPSCRFCKGTRGGQASETRLSRVMASS